MRPNGKARRDLDSSIIKISFPRTRFREDMDMARRIAMMHSNILKDRALPQKPISVPLQHFFRSTGRSLTPTLRPSEQRLNV